MKIFKTDTAAKLQSELDRLTRKRAALASRLVAAESAAAAAQEARRRHLIESDDIEASAGVKFSEAVDAAQRDVTAISGAISELDAMIAEGRAAIIAAKESAARAKRAAEISKRIERLEPMIATAEKQFEALAATLEKIAETADDSALDVRQYVELIGHADRLPVTSIVAASLAESIFHTSPDLLTVTKSLPAGMFARAVLPVMCRRHGGMSVDLPIDEPGAEASFIALPLSGALTQNIIAPLRTAAAEILAGTRSIAQASTVIDGEGAEAEPVFNYPWLVFVKPATWIDWRGKTVKQADSRAMVPEPVARAAIAAGVAFPEDAPEAVAHEGLRYKLDFHSPSVSMTKDVVTLDVKWPATTRAAA